jgi:hypothetical protein
VKKKSIAAVKGMAERRRDAPRVFPAFSITLTGQLSAQLNTAHLLLFNQLVVKGIYGIDFQSPSEVTIPASLFRDEPEASAFITIVNNLFGATLADALATEAGLVLDDVIQYALKESGIASPDFRKVAKAHANKTNIHVAKRLGLQRTGKKPEWDRFALSHAVLATLKGIEKEDRTLDKCVEVMRTQYGNRIPGSKEAFRKMLTRLDLSWRELKSGRLS